MNRDYYTIPEVAAKLGKSRWMIHKWIREEFFPVVHVRSSMIVPKDRLERWMKDHEDLVCVG